MAEEATVEARTVVAVDILAEQRVAAAAAVEAAERKEPPAERVVPEGSVDGAVSVAAVLVEA